mgnify:CR=1 FL=1
MLKIIKHTDKKYKVKLNSYINKGTMTLERKSSIVRTILNDIKKDGNKSLIRYIKKFENKKINTEKKLSVSITEIKNAKKKCSKEFLDAVVLSIRRVSEYQKKLLPKSFRYKDSIGMKLGCLWSPIDSCALYVPGGKAFYPSSVIMNAVPAKLAGVKRIVITTPTSEETIRPEILATAELLGIKEIYRCGGAQAIGAMTFGTKTINRVDKIVGPGNAYVAEAKKQVFGNVGVDSIAGPSEIMIIADKYNNPEWIALDLLSQAEHDEEARPILITDNQKIIDSVNFYIKKHIKNLSREKIAKASIISNGIAICVSDINRSFEIINEIAPEHLEIMIKNSAKLVNNIRNAGAIFVGQFSPEALGDYLAGPSHVLPTSGNARFDSGLSVLDFLKRTSYIESTKKSLGSVVNSIESIAKSEGLDAHAKSAVVRFRKV